MTDEVSPPPPTPLFQAVEDGVRVIATGRVIRFGSPAWDDYQAYLAAGGVTLPAAPPLPLTLDEEAARTENALREAQWAELRGDAALRALRNRTPAEVSAWIDANVSNLAEARTVLKMLARVIAALIRERL